MKIEGLVVGAGIIGSAVAYELSRRGVSGLHVADPDLEGSLSSTERNAGGVRHLWQQSINTELSRVSISLFERLRQSIGFQQTGYLWLFSREKTEQGKDLLRRARERKLGYEELSIQGIRDKYSFIDKVDDLAFALLGPKDGLINSNALKNFYREEAKARGVVFHDRVLVTGIDPHGVTVAHIEDPQPFLSDPEKGQHTFPVETWKSDFVVLCGGAWMAWLFKKMGQPPLVRPVRRQISLFKAEGFDMTPYGMVVDTSRVYFHPEGGNILAGLVLDDEPPGYRFDYDADFFESHIWPALYERSTKMERLKPMTGWGGLYSYTPDTTGILGRLQGFKNIYEAHSFTGRGVMQSYGAAVAIAELILDGSFSTFDATPLSRERFLNGNLLPEGLHI